MINFHFSGPGRFVKKEFILYKLEPDIVMITMINKYNKHISLLHNKLSISIYPDNDIFIYHSYCNKEIKYSGSWFKILPMDILTTTNNICHCIIDDFTYPNGDIGVCQLIIEFTNKGIKKIKQILTIGQI